MAVYGIVRGISMFLRLISYAILIYCILSWVLPPYNKVMMFFARIIDPLLRPIRRLLLRFLPRIPLDLSPLVLGLLLQLIERIVWWLAMLLI